MRRHALLAGMLISSLLSPRRGESGELREVWSARYDSPVPASAPARRVVVDAAGNVIVAAEVVAEMGRQFPEVVKYDAQGKLLWVRELRETAVTPGSRMALAVDGEGDIHLALNHLPPDAGHDSATDVLTVRYDPDGQLLWQAEHGEPELTDTVNDLIADGSGGTVVTGSENGKDWITIRYDDGGAPVWLARHPARMERVTSYARALAPGDAGSVYVLGRLDFELVLLRYDAAGKLEWEARAGEGIPGGIGLDQSGAVYVSGSHFEGNDQRFDILKYDSGGQQQWRFGYPGFGGEEMTLDVAVLPGGGAYAAAVHTAGTLGGGDQLLVLAVDAEGRRRWVEGESVGCAVSLAVDPAGELLLLSWMLGGGMLGAGIDFRTSKFSPEGVRLWLARHDDPAAPGEVIDDFPSDLALDAAGHPVSVGFVTAPGGSRVGVALKYTARGGQEWLAQVPGVGGLADEVRALAVDDQGNIHVVGIAGGDGEKLDVVVAQHRPDGTLGWASRIPATQGIFREARAARLDREGQLLVCGMVKAPPTHTAVALLFKLERDGAFAWQATHGNVSQGEARANDLAVDDAGNAYMTGAAQGSETGLDWMTVKVSPAGRKLWAVAEHAGDNDEATAIAASPDGGVLVTGRSSTLGGAVYLTVRYDAEGRKVWAASFGELDGYSEATALAPAADGGAHVTGTVLDPTHSRAQYATVRYDRDGNQMWVVLSGGPQVNCCTAPMIVADAAGDAWVSGKEGLTQRYSREGRLLWEAKPTDLEVGAIALDGAGGVLVAGTLETHENRSDLFVVHYDADGQTAAAVTHEAPRLQRYRMEAMASDRHGDIVLAGSTGTLLGSSDFLTVKLRREDDPFLRGDVNLDGRFDLADGISLIGALYRGGPQPRCPQAADIDADGAVGLTDAIFCIAYQLLGGPAPTRPFPQCGEAAIASELRCVSSACR